MLTLSRLLYGLFTPLVLMQIKTVLDIFENNSGAGQVDISDKSCILWLQAPTLPWLRMPSSRKAHLAQEKSTNGDHF